MIRHLFVCLVLCGCSAEPAARYLIPSPQQAEPVRLSVETVELRDVVLPGHASASEVLVQNTEGGLVPMGAAIWADDPVRSVTATLAHMMDEGSTATIVAEPWPLFDRPQAQVEVRFTRMLARADGTFEMTGQVAISSADRSVRERVERFDLTAPLAEITPKAVADAAGQGLSQLSGRILGYLR